jgi:monoamine oxidase
MRKAAGKEDPAGQARIINFLPVYQCSQRAGAMTAGGRLEFVSHEMEKVYPGLLENVEGGVSKVWLDDPWAGGAVSIPSPGQMTTLCMGIDNAEGRVHFAGDHTSRWTAWMQGALQSGLRAAKEVNDASAALPSPQQGC